MFPFIVVPLNSRQPVWRENVVGCSITNHYAYALSRVVLEGDVVVVV